MLFPKDSIQLRSTINPYFTLRLSLNLQIWVSSHYPGEICTQFPAWLFVNPSLQLRAASRYSVEVPKNSINYFSSAIIMDLANQILKLEKTKSEDWDESSPFQRGEDRSKIIRSSYKDISDEDCVRLSAWVDIALICEHALKPQDWFKSLMNTEEAVSALLNLEATNFSRSEVNPFTGGTYKKSFRGDIEAVYEWASDFGCLLVQGRQTDIDQSFVDFIHDYLLQIEAIQELD
jgi:hypothetical protein